MLPMTSDNRVPLRREPSPAGVARAVRPGGRQALNWSLAYKAFEDSTIEIYDLDFAAYCLMEGLPIADMVEENPKRNGQPPRYLFRFQGDKETINTLSVRYTNSDCAKFADCVRRLKKAIRSTCPRES
jgi:hypothetical protein